MYLHFMTVLLKNVNMLLFTEVCIIVYRILFFFINSIKEIHGQKFK